ncbi:hypothetical protein [Streptosporangium sp. NBC_01756]|uniref:hypothetical protein n=1 Tax=Streptosporangium sp. NBC_01756 TaxID=2975950 RepID=UPI002DDB1E68|nr:hypothetical protein [Streptosporangium sp. NBC_01756]WSC86935.1 hypothetical protein OIE48_01545 [Streptosporangium sp. NBC_01756]
MPHDNLFEIPQSRRHLLRVHARCDLGCPIPLLPDLAPAEHEKRQAYPEAVEQAHAEFATLQAST